MAINPMKWIILLVLLTPSAIFAQDPPSLMEYQLFDSDFDWIEIRDIAESVNDLGDNDFAGPFDIGFGFPFYGEYYEEFYVCSNGYIGFGPDRGYHLPENQNLPYSNSPNNIIAVFWKDLDPSVFWSDCEVLYGVRDNSLVVDFRNIAESYEDGIYPENTVTMQAILPPSGSIKIQYKRIGEDFVLSEGTVGIESANGSHGLTVYFDDEGIEIADETAYIITQHPAGKYLVWDAGLVTQSGATQVDALEYLGHTVDHLFLANEALPDDLEEYEGVFVNLGNYGEFGRNYHQLSEDEGAILAVYLDNGGNLYLEGSDTWSQDLATNVHPYFNILGGGDGEALETPIEGIDGGFADGLIFNEYETEENRFVDHMRSTNGSKAVFTFREEDQSYIGMISNLQENYRTIGCSFEFGGLVDGEEGSKNRLMRRMIEFFRTSAPEFPAPLGLEARAGNGEVVLSWNSPFSRQFGWQRLFEIDREIAALVQSKRGVKTDPDD